MIDPLQKNHLSRRALLAGVPWLLAGCANSSRFEWPAAAISDYGQYGPLAEGSITIPAIDMTTVDAALLRREVAWHGPQRPGSIVVAIPERRLYLVKANGRALRYAVGVGREEALNFRGSAVIGNKEVWPHWTPTASMIARVPRYRAYAGGMPGGLDNPLGARALYLYRDKHDTFFRLHGTNEPESIGGAVSSGCIRLFNQDIIDLYNRVPLGTPVTVLQG